MRAIDWEKEWHGTCQNTYGEETKQLLYAEKMGLVRCPDEKTPYRFDMKGISVLDIGGGPASLLLKCVNVKGKVVDPLDFPKWVSDRYELAGIAYELVSGEELNEINWDECWIYNVLQHVEDPEKVIENAMKAGKLIRIFEWVGMKPSPGHKTLSEDDLNRWLGGEGKVEQLTGQNGCFGKAYYGVFPTGGKGGY